MIYETLAFFVNELNNYMNIKLGSVTDIRLKMGNVSKALDETLTGANSLSGRAILSLVNVEEDHISRQQENYVKTDIATRYKQPALFLNLYVLFAINKAEYDDSLKWLSCIMQYFQHQQVFTPITHPGLNSKIERLIVDLYSLNFEQVNHLWSTLGGKYMPSVLYKIRQLSIDENATVSEGGFIKEITINDMLKTPVS